LWINASSGHFFSTRVDVTATLPKVNKTVLLEWSSRLISQHLHSSFSEAQQRKKPIETQVWITRQLSGRVFVAKSCIFGDSEAAV
jgi:hypothetical protein